MKSTPQLLAFALSAVLAAAALLPAAALTPAAPAKSAPGKPAISAAQRSFASPEEAVKVLVDTVRAADVKGLVAIVGTGSEAWLFTGDNVSDREDWKRFLASYDQKSSLAKEGEAKRVLNIGADDWPFPAPIVKKGDRWVFDSAAGREEVTNRRVGRNELDAIQTLLAVVDAQREYAVADADRNGYTDYARRFLSSQGKKDGLFWPAKAGEPASPLGPLVAVAAKEGYGKKVAAGAPQPYHGYHYRILAAQGKDAPGGAYDYLVKDKLLGGFAVVAYPAKYGVSGVMTFMVNHDGVVHEKDLGSATASAAGGMTRYNPDRTWKKAQP